MKCSKCLIIRFDSFPAQSSIYIVNFFVATLRSHDTVANGVLGRAVALVTMV